MVPYHFHWERRGPPRQVLLNDVNGGVGDPESLLEFVTPTAISAQTSRFRAEDSSRYVIMSGLTLFYDPFLEGIHGPTEPVPPPRNAPTLPLGGMGSVRPIHPSASFAEQTKHICNQRKHIHLKTCHEFIADPYTLLGYTFASPLGQCTIARVFYAALRICPPV